LGSKESALAYFNLHPNKRYYLLVSTSHKRKGLDLLVKVFQNLDEHHVLLVAGTRFVSTQANVISLGFVKNMKLLYQASDLLLHPANYEPFGQIVTEAFASKVPVIVSPKVGAKELINTNRGIIVKDFEVNSWIKAIKDSENIQFNFEDIEQLLQEISLEKHMDKMLSWAMIKK
jgi:glycosyltransferase involved in cell wall biosynthesis